MDGHEGQEESLIYLFPCTQPVLRIVLQFLFHIFLALHLAVHRVYVMNILTVPSEEHQTDRSGCIRKV